MEPVQPAEPKIIMTEEIRARWNSFAPIYDLFDSTMQTFYYTLINMLNISKANHILEIACGTGKLLPLAVNLKPQECTYLATDLCETMIEFLKIHLASYLEKVGVQEPLESWMARNHLDARVANGAEKIESPHKFDRIICNLVLMLVEDPVKALENLNSVAAEGCLLGLTVWGDANYSNLLTMAGKGLKQLGLPAPNVRSNFHLFNRIQQIADKSGWEPVIQWEQNAPFNYFSLDENLNKMVKDFSMGKEPLKDYFVQKITETFKEKKILNFPTQIAILRKK